MQYAVIEWGPASEAYFWQKPDIDRRVPINLYGEKQRHWIVILERKADVDD